MTPAAALASWDVDGEVRPSADNGNINRTYEVGDPPIAILQWVNPIFRPEINLDIQDAVVRLTERGLTAPRLLTARDGGLWVPDEAGGHWRLTSFLPGRTLHKLATVEHARAAGAYVGRFHAALAPWTPTFRAPRLGVHDTLRHMAFLDETARTVTTHPLAKAVAPVATDILATWAGWRGTVDLPEHVAHGDLKVSNLRFATTGPSVAGILDLDTLAWLPYAVEMGDAWRSWCNPVTEDDLQGTRFDAALFGASLDGWIATAPTLTAVERAAIVPGIERIAIELSARFCADALNNRYFREDRERYPDLGTHCLARARAQLALAKDVRAQARDLEAVVGRALPKG